MDKREKILLGSEDIKSQKIQDIFININLERSSNEIWPQEYTNQFDVTRQYNTERNNCRNFRIYGIIDSYAIDCDNLNIFVYTSSTRPTQTQPFLPLIIKSQSLINNNWPIYNVCGKKKGKYLLALDGLFDTNIITLEVDMPSGITENNIFEQQLVFTTTTLDASGQKVPIVIDYGTNEVVVDADGNQQEVDNDFDFFYNKHWIENDIFMPKYRPKIWIVDENDWECVEMNVATKWIVDENDWECVSASTNSNITQNSEQ